MPQPELMAVAEAVRVCEHCKWRRPIEHFDGDSPVCKYCRESIHVQDARQVRLDKAKDVFDRIVSSAGIEKGKYTLDDVVCGQIDEMGGLQSWLTAWRMQFQEAMDTHPGSKVVLDQFTNTAKLLGMAERLRHEERVIDMKDEELAMLKERELNRLIGYSNLAPAKEEILQAAMQGVTKDDLPDEMKVYSVENG